MEVESSRGDAEPRSETAAQTAPSSPGLSRRPMLPIETAFMDGRHEAGQDDICCLEDEQPPRLRAPSSENADRIIAIARSWIGTPYVHQASVKHIGCDCLGLLRGIWRELTGEEPEETPPYSLDWAEATGAETLYMALKRHAREIGPERLAPADIALFRMLPRGPAKHCGIIAQGQSPIGNRQSNRPGKSIAECLAPNAGFTLIHARQNKRVSEEPLSPFWRGKLAFAFRLGD